MRQRMPWMAPRRKGRRRGCGGGICQSPKIALRDCPLQRGAERADQKAKFITRPSPPAPPRPIRTEFSPNKGKTLAASGGLAYLGSSFQLYHHLRHHPRLSRPPQRSRPLCRSSQLYLKSRFPARPSPRDAEKVPRPRRRPRRRPYRCYFGAWREAP